jgi:2'-5' RNA ligase
MLLGYDDLEEGYGAMITYVKDTSKWEDWQRDYRLGLILIIPPDEVSRQIDSLRAEYDPRAYAICPTHISLSDPLRREMTPELEKEVREILSKIEPFTLRYDKPHASTEHPGVAYPITPQEPIDNLKEALHAAAVFEGKVYRRRHVPAHMTIAEFISIEDSLRLCADLQDSAPSGSFLCDRLEFIVPDKSFRFQKRGTFFLGPSS